MVPFSKVVGAQEHGSEVRLQDFGRDVSNEGGIEGGDRNDGQVNDNVMIVRGAGPKALELKR